ncbi:MAG: BrnA antitoxin family protein [Rickettsiales bacterium]
MRAKYKGTRKEDNIDELGDEFFKKAVRIGRPVSTNHKKRVTLRLDDKVISAWKATGKGWQTRLNALLVSIVEQKIL